MEKQKYADKKDESLGMKIGKESSQKRPYMSRRDAISLAAASDRLLKKEPYGMAQAMKKTTKRSK